MSKQNLKDQTIALQYEELKNLEKEWLKRVKNISDFFYYYQKKEFVKSIVEDLRKIANKTLADFK